MSKLALAIGIGDTVLPLDSALTPGSLPAPYVLDAEQIMVTGGSGTALISVARGQNGTARATHTAGTTLTAGETGGSGLPSQWNADSHGAVTAASDSATGTPLTVVGSTAATALVVTTPLGSRIEIGDTLLADSDAADGGMAIESTQPANDGEYIWKILVNGVKIFNQDSDGPVLIRVTRQNATALLVADKDGSGVLRQAEQGGLYIGPVRDTTAPTMQVQAQTAQTSDLFAVVDSVTAPLFRIGPAGQVYALALPTADPHVAGQLWNSAATLKVSAG